MNPSTASTIRSGFVRRGATAKPGWATLAASDRTVSGARETSGAGARPCPVAV